MTMEILESNFANTTTQFVVNDNTTSVSNIFNPDIRFQYSTVNLNDDNTTATMVISFAETLTVDRFWLSGHDLKDYTVFYNGATANTFAIIGGDTTVSDYSSNSETSQYFRVTPVACTSVSIDMDATIVSNMNKYIGYLGFSEARTTFDGRIPAAQNYRPTRKPKQIRHQMSDGGIRLHTLDDKLKTAVTIDYITEALKDELEDIYIDYSDFVFCPFGTTTSWDTFIFPAVWIGDFNFYTFSDNASKAGFSGSIDFAEVSI